MQAELEQNKATIHQFYQAGVERRLTAFGEYVDPNFIVRAPNYLPWGGPPKNATFFRNEVLPNLPNVFDFSRFSYETVTAEDDRVAAVINMGVTGTDDIIKILDLWAVQSGKVIALWVAYFEPQALLDKLDIAHRLNR
jgi:ketosteroid isomerase-like protein